ncbi:MAG: amino acid decarboxylase, partial [Firmicutes bacterium]|nr:amino acid decarboxylase [Bacillota bacterium]
STSPPYPTMASLDIARAWMQARGADEFAKLAETVADLRECAVNAGFELPVGECDPVRLTLLTECAGVTGDEVAEYFRSRGIECEHSDRTAVIFILTPFNTSRDISHLRSAIVEFEAGKPLINAADELKFCRLPKCAMTPREAVTHSREFVPTAQAEGRIAAEAACPCPPGVPVVMPGEIIDKECIKILLNTGINEINVLK